MICGTSNLLHMAFVAEQAAAGVPFEFPNGERTREPTEAESEAFMERAARYRAGHLRLERRGAK